ncbi:zinc-ribbon domain-containing protein [Pseudobutyrivibrio sp. YE44]|uniref:zinc ribbon domain-containing protein n=1 Tax=Pseudobutyrivibrio sp. YE44 TaxID=1520802 RepID=UPI000890C6BD|nr:zinc ribbon domain-containing protein [Pseudobutyrivibrio sp. YE44]SDB25825.1 zinc-ribbon domain-containing protein [Pseudobutyrivibrio sp. YE44]
MAFCEQCGAELQAGNLFCAQCGTPVRGAGPVPENNQVEENVQVAEATPVAPVQEATPAAPVQEATPVAPVQEATPVAPVQEPTPVAPAQEPVYSAPVNNGPVYTQPVYTEPVYNQAPPAPAKKKKKFPVVAIILLVIFVILAVVGIFFGISISKTMNINDYTSVEFSGYDTMGKAEVVIDEDKFMEDFGKKANKKNKPHNMSDLEDGIDYELDKETDLSNGESVELTWDIDADYIKKTYGVKLKFTDTNYTVGGLEQVDTFNPFDDMTLEFSGVNGKGQCSVKVTNEDTMYDDLTFSLDKSSDLSEGDTVTVTFGKGHEDDLNEYAAEHYGTIPTETEKEFTVEGLGEYVSKVSQLSEEAIKEMGDKAAEVCKDDIEKTDLGDLSVKVDNTETAAAFVILNRDGSGNKIDFVVKLDVTITSAKQSGEEKITYYRAASFYDVAVNKDGECSYDLNNYDLDDHSAFEYRTNFKYSGRLKWSIKFFGFESVEDANTFISENYDVAYDIDSSLAPASEGEEAEDTEASEESEE